MLTNRQKALLSFALNFMKANLEEDDLVDFDPFPTEEEIEELREALEL